MANEEYEVAIERKQICEMLKWSRSKFYYKKRELLEAGVIFYLNIGRPPRKKIMGFPSRIKRWTGLKGLKGEIV